MVGFDPCNVFVYIFEGFRGFDKYVDFCKEAVVISFIFEHVGFILIYIAYMDHNRCVCIRVVPFGPVCM